MQIEELVKFYEIKNSFISESTNRLCWMISDQESIRFRDTDSDKQLWNNIIDACKNDPLLKKKNFCNVQQPLWNNNTYVIQNDKNYKSILICKRMLIYYCYYSLSAITKNDISAEMEQKINNECKTKHNTKGIGGYANFVISQMVQEQLETKRSLYDLLSGSSHKNEWTDIKLCVPRQIGWVNPLDRLKIVENCFKADISSAFPFQLTKPIPTLKYCKRLKGKVAPNAKYPFAFYIKSHHLAIYNELSTEEDNRSIFLGQVSSDYRKVADEDEETILCKQASFTLEDIMKELYNTKNTAETEEEIKFAKLIMNACIGYFHYNKKPGLSFISAVVIARSNHYVLDLIDKLEDQKNRIEYIATDSIVWKGKDSDVATNEKYLGSFTKEYNNCKFYGVQVGAYQIEKEDGSVKTLCFYIDDEEEKKNIKFGSLPKPKKGKGLTFSNECYVY